MSTVGPRPPPMLHGTDDQYMLDLGEHVDRIKCFHLSRLGSDLNRNWTELASRLGLSNGEVMAIEDRYSRVPTVVAGYEVLNIWRLRPNSTIRVLRQVLVDMRRDDAVMTLDSYRLNKVALVMVVHRNGRFSFELSGSCPARKPLVDHVRPQIYRHLSMDDLMRGVVVQFGHASPAMGGASAGSPRACWTSPAAIFESQQVNMELTEMLDPRSAMRPKSDSRKASVDTTQLCNGRRVISWLENDNSLVFSVASDDTCVPVQESMLPDSCRLFSDNRGPVSRPSDSERSSCSDNVGDEEFENRLPVPDDEVFEPEPEAIELREARRIPGFHFISPRTSGGGHQSQVTAILLPYMSENGRYIIRNSSRYEHIKLAITVTFNGGMLNYYVYSQRAASTPTYIAYTLSVEGEAYRWHSLDALIEHYRIHPLPGTPSPSGCGGGSSAAAALPSLAYCVQPILTHGVL